MAKSPLLTRTPNHLTHGPTLPALWWGKWGEPGTPAEAAEDLSRPWSGTASGSLWEPPADSCGQCQSHLVGHVAGLLWADPTGCPLAGLGTMPCALWAAPGLVHHCRIPGPALPGFQCRLHRPLTVWLTGCASASSSVKCPLFPPGRVWCGPYEQPQRCWTEPVMASAQAGEADGEPVYPVDQLPLPRLD